MTDLQEERRDPKAQRKPVSTLVEVCGSVPGVPVFEAESMDVSARGMHLRTAYLPQEGTPLVCRFESEGREIVVEGTVAWRREAGRGGEFGVRFTALDSRSVDALRGMCSPDGARSEAKAANAGEPGARVRLHIDGLGAPMKARVKTGKGTKVQVGSSLEFLKVGRRLELEDLDAGGRRPAEIDGVSVVVDPGTQIPQLVVALRFEGAEEQTPSPSTSSVDGAQSGDEPKMHLRIPSSAVTTDAGRSKRESAPAEAAPERAPAKTERPAAPKSEASERESDDDDDAPEMRGRVAVMAANAEKHVKEAGEQLARATSQAGQGAANLFRGATAKLLSFRKKNEAPQRRTTSPVPSSNVPQEKPRLRQQSSANLTSETPSVGSSRKVVAIAACVSLVGVTALMFALRGAGGTPPSASKSSDVVNAALDDHSPSAPAGSAAPGQNTNGAVTANVPLFGPTALATTEPAPLGPPPGSEAADVEASEKAAARASLAPSQHDDGFSDDGEDSAPRSRTTASDDKPAKPHTKPEDVSAWGHGKMHEPVIHRLRLDAPGAAIEGNVDPTGFTVVIPERKVMEATANITKRDERIARVKANNTGSGAQISFRFKDGVPSYRVRLRRDFVEFLISEPSPQDKPSKTDKPAKPDSKHSDGKRKQG